VSSIGLCLHRNYKEKVKIIKTITFCKSPKKNNEVKKAKKTLRPLPWLYLVKLR